MRRTKQRSMIDRRKRSLNLKRFTAAVFMLISAFLLCVALMALVKSRDGEVGENPVEAGSKHTPDVNEVKTTGTVILLTTPTPIGTEEATMAPTPIGTAQATMNPTPEAVE